MWTRLQNLRPVFRWPIKWLLVLAALFLVSFPNPLLFVRHVHHWQDPNSMIDPGNAELQPWVAEFKDGLTPDMPPPAVLKSVEKFVYRKVPYKFDWETWGSADYLPTLAEVMEMGAEDCDGQAVVAASILRNLGYKADLVTDFAHVWVKTDRGETMHPGKRKSVEATRKGIMVHWQALTETLPQALAYSVSPFPLMRELIVLAVVWLVLLRPGVTWSMRLLCAALMIEGLLFLRAGGTNWKRPVVWAQWWGVLHLAAALSILFYWGWRAGRSSRAADQTSSA